MTLCPPEFCRASLSRVKDHHGERIQINNVSGPDLSVRPFPTIWQDQRTVSGLIFSASRAIRQLVKLPLLMRFDVAGSVGRAEARRDCDSKGAQFSGSDVLDSI